MEIKKIQGIVLCHILIVGLAACSNTGYRVDDSPWKTKHNAEFENSTSEEFVEVVLDEELGVNVMEENSDMVEVVVLSELETYSDFDSERVPVESRSAFEKLEAVEPDVVETSGVVEEQSVAEMSKLDIMSVSSSAYVVQAYAGRVLANANRYIGAHDLDNMRIVKTNKEGNTINVVISIHDDLDSAKQAVIDIEEKTGSKPWIRLMGELQKIIIE